MPLLAVCFKERIEHPVLDHLPLMYCRCKDDCYIVTSIRFKIVECFRLLIEQSRYTIRFTRETAKNGLSQHAALKCPAGTLARKVPHTQLQAQQSPMSTWYQVISEDLIITVEADPVRDSAE